ncbi:MAG: LamG-like jellyroll fold domain-containing protein, partial [Muribaculaceae bacterium]
MYLINNSDSQEDGWYDLRLDAESNKDGAQVFVDGAPVGATGGLAFMIPGGSTLSKTVEVRKGKVLNYDGLKFSLQSQCQCDPTDPLDDIMDTVRVSVHFIPSATDVAVKRPTENWTYNTKLPTSEVNGLDKHYMDVKIDGFDVNYDSFHRIMLQYKPASDSDEDWITLMSYYNDSTAYYAALDKSMNAEMINSKDGGVINYRFFMDHLPDQRYDIRAVGTSMINNIEYYNYSEVRSGIKDMYNPRLFGSAQPANGVLTVNDEIRLNFNETIAEGLLTDKNFEVTGVRNGAQSDHSVSVSFDGENDVLATEFVRNWHGKPLTVEMWILADKPQDAVLFSQGTANSAIELGITADNRLRVKVGGKETVSNNTFDYEQGTWANVALVYDGTNKVSAYYNWVELISEVETDGYAGEGSYVFGSSINGTKHYAGKMHNARIWDKELSRSRLQTNSLTILSGAESNLIAYYPMNEARGEMIADKAHGANLEMKGGTWVVPEGRAATFNGSNYLKLSTKACQVDLTMDYTIELWFRAKEGSKNAGLFSNGRGDGSEYMHSQDCIELGFDEDGKLYFCNNGITATCTGVFNDNNWHHAAVAVNRTSGRAQIYIDGKLNTYFDANDLGGIKGDYLLLGARMRYSDELETSETIDNYFEGEIDEFRIWNLYRSEAIESETNSQKLDGTEMGLLTYYPFESYEEKQGASYVIYSYSDAKVQRDASTVIPDAEVMGGGSVETSLSAPVRGKDPVSKLLYDFVVNNDALIINLKEPYDRVEKTIVTFTVSGVRDLNGNEIVSPITWSAYVDRNQLKWGDSSMSIVKKVNEEKEFTVRATNNGGSIEHFTIENMPSWLDVTPTSGTINPLSSIDVKFTVDPSLNIGTYDEVVYLRNDNNVVESLQLTVKVEGEKPSWSVNPADYQYNMSIFGKLLIDNI